MVRMRIVYTVDKPVLLGFYIKLNTFNMENESSLCVTLRFYILYNSGIIFRVQRSANISSSL